MKNNYEPPKLFVKEILVEDVLAVSKVEDTIDIFDLGVNEDL